MSRGVFETLWGMAKRLDTRLKSEGAEFLVLGQLLIAGIEATKADRNFEGFDLYASNPAAGKTCRIQLKSRWATDYDGGFPIKNLSSDFVVVALNRGYRYRRKTGSSENGVRAPEFFVFPTPVVEAAKDPKSNGARHFFGAWTTRIGTETAGTSCARSSRWARSTAAWRAEEQTGSLASSCSSVATAPLGRISLLLLPRCDSAPRQASRPP